MTDIEKEIVKDYESGYGINKLRSKYSVSQTNIYEILSRNNVPIRSRGGQKRQLRESDIQRMIDLYNKRTSLKELEKEFRTAKENIKEILKSNGVKTRDDINVTYIPEGAQFNDYTYLYELVERRNKKIYWKVECVCGVQRELSKWDVVSGKSKGCGCRKSKGDEVQIKDRKEYSSRVIYKEYEKSARVRGYSFDLTLEEFRILADSSCYYCGTSKSSTRVDSVTGYIYEYMGVDRMNNEVGYEVNNVVPCCFPCNRMKNTMNHEEFLSIISKIYHNLATK